MQSAAGDIRQSYQRPLYQYLQNNSALAVEKMVREYEREIISEEVFSAVFTGLEHEHMDKVRAINSALAKFVQWT